MSVSTGHHLAQLDCVQSGDMYDDLGGRSDLSARVHLSYRHQKRWFCIGRNTDVLRAVQTLKRDLSSLLDSASDEWVPPENWKAA